MSILGALLCSPCLPAPVTAASHPSQTNGGRALLGGSTAVSLRFLYGQSGSSADIFSVISELFLSISNLHKRTFFYFEDIP